ncbi:MAG: hypothetical protein KC535_06245, partial [Nanoarchaeota archaeon]|nr:hypothetical protein [Nanoarchaeota archaeon]
MVKHDTVNKSKKKTNSSSIIIIIAAIVIIALIGGLFIIKPGQEGTTKYKKSDYETYHGFNFEQQGKYWVTFVELSGVRYEAPFYNHPLDVQDIYYQDNITEFVIGEPHTNFTIAVSDNVGATPVLAGANIARITGKLYGMPTSSALYALPDERTNQTNFP